MARYTKIEQQNAIDELGKLLKPGDTVYTKITSVAKSGMSRTIDCYIARDSKIRWISRWVAHATGNTWDDKRESVRVNGCGMDMGFALVYELSSKLFPSGFKVDGIGRNGDTSGHDKDGGYALRQEWI